MKMMCEMELNFVRHPLYIAQCVKLDRIYILCDYTSHELSCGEAVCCLWWEKKHTSVLSIQLINFFFFFFFERRIKIHMNMSHICTHKRTDTKLPLDHRQISMRIQLWAILSRSIMFLICFSCVELAVESANWKSVQFDISKYSHNSCLKWRNS